MKKIDDETLFRYFGAETTDEEECRINDWLLQDSENEKKLRASYSLWEAMLFTDAGSGTPVKTAARHKKSFRRFGIAILNAAAIALFFILAKHIVTISEDNRLAETINRIEVPAGGKMDITLPDGTKVCLNAGAILDYPMKFSRNSREVTISGEAWFDVAHNKAKPFIVKTFFSDVEALGTKFNLDADESAGRFSVTLEEGSIRLRGNAGERVMAPGEKVEIIGGEMRDCQYRSGKANSWMSGIIDISGLTFSEIIRKLERTFGVTIVVNMENVPAIGFSEAELRQSEGVEAALKSLQYAGVKFHYNIDFKTGTIYIK